MEDYFSIGELSRYQNISKQTLIFYDKLGLFQPAYVDPSNGYRYYTARQLDELDTILILKKSGLSLQRIKELLEHYTTESSQKVLREQLGAIDRQMGGAAFAAQPPFPAVLPAGGRQPPQGGAAPAGSAGGAVPAHPAGGGPLLPAGNQHCHQAVLCPGVSRGAAHLLPKRGAGALGAHFGKALHRGVHGLPAH